MKILFLAITSAALLLSACGGKSSSNNSSVVSDSKPDIPPSHNTNSEAFNVPDGFDYRMHKDLTIRLQVLDHNENPGRFIGVQVFEPLETAMQNEESSAPNLSAKPKLILRGQTDGLGYFEDNIRLPGHLKEVEIQVSQLGIENRAVLSIGNHDLFHEFK